MPEYRQALCLFCKVGKEKLVVERIREQGYGRAIFPQKTRSRRNKVSRQWEDESAPLLPGYVFLYETGAAAPRDKLLSLPDVIRILGYASDESDCLRGRDLEFAQWLWQTDGKLERLQVVEVGNRLRIADGASRALLGAILRVDRRRGTCQVALDGQRIFQRLWLPYEVIDPTRRDAPEAPPFPEQ